MRDSTIVHFLRRFPAWLVLMIVLLVTLWLYVRTQDQFFQRVIDTVLGGLMAILTGTAIRASTQKDDSPKEGKDKEGEKQNELENLS